MLTFTLLLLAAQPAAEPRERVSVLDFEASGVAPAIAAGLASSAAAELARLDVADVMTAETVRTLLSAERQRQLLGVEGSGLGQLAQALDCRFFVSGRVTALSAKAGEPKKLSLEVSLLDSKAGKRVATQAAQVDSEVALFQAVKPAVYQLAQPLLAGKTGHLAVTARESGAAVKVDEALVGSTPLAARVELKAGPHLVAVEKDGFVREVREVKVAPGGVAQLDVRLAPSPDFAQTYEKRARGLRTGAWLSTALAVLGAGAFVTGQVLATRTYGDAETPGTFAFHRAQLLDGPGQPGVDHLLEAQRLKAQVGGFETMAGVGLGVGAAAAIAAVVFFLVGEPPGAYAAYADSTGGSK